jgi:hypothetical protein
VQPVTLRLPCSALVAGHPWDFAGASSDEVHREARRIILPPGIEEVWLINKVVLPNRHSSTIIVIEGGAAVSKVTKEFELPSVTQFTTWLDMQQRYLETMAGQADRLSVLAYLRYHLSAHLASTDDWPGAYALFLQASRSFAHVPLQPLGTLPAHDLIRRGGPMLLYSSIPDVVRAEASALRAALLKTNTATPAVAKKAKCMYCGSTDHSSGSCPAPGNCPECGHAHAKKGPLAVDCSEAGCDCKAVKKR